MFICFVFFLIQISSTICTGFNIGRDITIACNFIKIQKDSGDAKSAARDAHKSRKRGTKTMSLFSLFTKRASVFRPCTVLHECVMEQASARTLNEI